MQITQRDIAMIQFINRFGFCITTHLSQKFNITIKRVRQVTKRLVDHDYLIKEKHFYGKHALYRLTNKGAQFTNLPPLSKFSMGAYHHTVALINLYLKITNRYPDAHWIDERTLLQEKYGDGVGKRGHCADAFLMFPDKEVAIEVELTSKNKRRLESIVKGYATNLSISEVWYFCSKEVLVAVRKVASQLDYVKVFDLSDFCKEDSHGR